MSVQYRLAPQSPFPGALTDVLMTYLSLLYPLPGSLHDPIASSSIVLVGDSSGANICLAMIQAILEFGRLQHTSCAIVHWNGRDVQLPKPAAVATMSAFTDLTRALPSWRREEDYDILSRDAPPPLQADFPACSAWPARPPRGDLYCDLSALCHPLVSPTAASDWHGAPPMLLLGGEERSSDSIKVIAQRAHSQGVQVVWEQYEGMPHTFMLVLKATPHSTLCFQHLAKFCQAAVGDAKQIKSQGVFIEVETLHARTVDMEHLTALTVEDARKMMHAQRVTKRVWTGPTIMKATL